MIKNPVFHLATIDDGKPRCSYVVFHTDTMKDVFKQISKNPNFELCFKDYKNNVQSLYPIGRLKKSIIFFNSNMF